MVIPHCASTVLEKRNHYKQIYTEIEKIQLNYSDTNGEYCTKHLHHFTHLYIYYGIKADYKLVKAKGNSY